MAASQSASLPHVPLARQSSTESVGHSDFAPAAPRRMVDRVLIALGRRDHRAEADALGLALRGCTKDQVGALADQLLALAGTPAEAAALGYAARAFDRIDPAKQQRLLAVGHGASLSLESSEASGANDAGPTGSRGVGSGVVGGWGEATAIGLVGAYPDEQAAIARLIGESLDPGALPHLCTLLACDTELVAIAAGRALIKAAYRVDRTPPLDELTRLSIEACLVRAAQDFPAHRRREALHALLMHLSTPAAWAASGPELRTFLQDHEHPAVLALRAVIKKDDDPRSRRAALQWLTYEPVRRAAIDRLFQHAHIDGQQSVLGAAHLLANPARAAALDRAGDLERADSTLTPEPAHLEHLSLEAARGAFAVATRWAPDALPALAEAALGDHRPAVRLRAVCSLGGTSCLSARGEPRDQAHSVDLLSDFTLDPNPHVARSAFLGFSSMDALPAHLLSTLSRSAHADLRALASLTPASDSPRHLHAFLASDRAAFVRDLQKLIIVGHADDRIRAIRLAQRLGLAPQAEIELLTIVQRAADLHASITSDERARDEQRIAASAVAALAESRSPAARIAVERALHHPDDRVRANALDALARAARRASQLIRGTPAHAALVEFKSDPRHRVRAGAIRADLLAALRDPAITDTGAPILRALTPLITDDRPMHRLSGLWLAERFVPELGLGWKDTSATQALCGAVDEISQADADPSVRARASRTASRLHARLRIGWGEHALPR